MIQDRMNGVLRLHLALANDQLNEEEQRLLKTYGDSSDGFSITRDILVPSDMTFHALHYAIMRLFGWQNCHQHNFSFNEKDFIAITQNRHSVYAKLCGIVFQYRDEDILGDFWDDDYEEFQNLKSWLKEKYTGPFSYHGHDELYTVSQRHVHDLIASIQVHAGKTPDEYYKDHLHEVNFVLERLPLQTILLGREEQSIPYEQWMGKMENTIQILKEQRAYSSLKLIKPVAPLVHSLRYRYDYGDGWVVTIKRVDKGLDANHRCADRKQMLLDNILLDGEEANEEMITALSQVLEHQRPACLKKDGMFVMENVGGMEGFCAFLKTIYESEDLELKKAALQWAKSMDWNRRKLPAKQMI